MDEDDLNCLYLAPIDWDAPTHEVISAADRILEEDRRLRKKRAQLKILIDHNPEIFDA